MKRTPRALGVLAALFPVVLVVIVVVDRLTGDPAPRTLDAWVAALESDEPASRDAATAELVRRGGEEPETVIPALVDAMRKGARVLGKRLRGGDRRVRLFLVVERPGAENDGGPESLWPGDVASWEERVEAELDRREEARVAGRPYVPADPRYRVVSPEIVRGPNPHRLFLLEVPRLPIGAWVFGTRTLHGAGERAELEVQKEVREAFGEFEERHRGRRMAFLAGDRVLALHTVRDPGSGWVRLEAPTSDAGAREDLSRLAVHPGESFHDGYTEAGNVLARLGPRVRPVLEDLAEGGEAEARVAAWAWWRLDANEAQAATRR